jgi:photosystem II stability/assembly factor-like uncharacterized protein
MKTKKAKYALEAIIAIAIAAAFVMPATAITPKTSSMNISSQAAPLPKDPEWIEQASGFPTPTRGIGYISIVDQNISWASGYDGTNPQAPCQDYTRTIDGGNTWVANTVAGADGTTFSMIYALDANTAWSVMWSSGGGAAGIYKTVDGGSIWVHQDTAVFNATSFPDCVYFWDANNGWCMGDPNVDYYEIYTTTDGGTTWTRVPSADIPAPLIGEFGVTGYFSVIGDTVWFGTNLGRVYKSTDKGLHWTVAQTTLSLYIKPVFKDANNGLAIDLNGDATQLSETSDGGATWTNVPFTGTCYDNDMCYVPDTTNMYVSIGAASGVYGGAYSLDGGHTWNDYSDLANTQFQSVAFTTGKVGWAGTFNTDEFTGGIWKHVPSEVTQPAFTIDIAGGKGINVTVRNIGDADATNITYTVDIAGGLFVQTRQFNGNYATLVSGGSFSFAESVFGIALGFIKGVPTITVTVTCSQDVTQTKTASAKIFFSRVILQ